MQAAEIRLGQMESQNLHVAGDLKIIYDNDVPIVDAINKYKTLRCPYRIRLPK